MTLTNSEGRRAGAEGDEQAARYVDEVTAEEAAKREADAAQDAQDRQAWEDEKRSREPKAEPVNPSGAGPV